MAKYGKVWQSVAKYGKVQVDLQFYFIFSTRRMSEFSFRSGRFTASLKSLCLHAGSRCILLLRWTKFGGGGIQKPL